MEGKKPFFSVITPFFNAEQYIFIYLEKLRSQTFFDWECILIDDYSNDNGFEILNNLIKGDKRLKVYKNKFIKKIKGPYQARNYGINLAKGEYVCFLDIDDYWMDNMLEIKYKLITENRKLDLIFTNYFRNSNSVNNIVSPLKFIPLKTQLKIHNPIGMLTSTVRRDLIINHKFKTINHEDYLFWAELVRDNPKIKIKHLAKTLAHYKVSETSISANKIKSLKWHLDCYEKLGYRKLKAIFCFLILIFIKTIVWLKLKV